MADTTPAPPESALGKQLAEEAKIAAFRKTISEAKEAESKAEKQAFDNQKAIKDDQRNDWKGPDVKPLEGKVTATGNYIETRLLANKQLQLLIAKLVEEMFVTNKFSNTDTFVIYHAASIPLMEMCYALTFQLKAFETDFGTLIGKGGALLAPAAKENSEEGGSAPLFIGLAASGILKTAADIFSLFRTDTTITNNDLAKDENLVTACFAEALLKTQTVKLYYPGTFPVNLFNKCDTQPELIKSYTAVKSKNCQAVELQRQIDVRMAAIDEQLSLGAADAAKTAQLQAERQTLSEGSLAFAATNAAFTQLESTLLAIDPTTKASLLSVLVHAEKLKELLASGTTYTVKIDADLSGSSIVKQNFFRATRLTHIGGARLSCLVFNNEGAIKFAHNLVGYSKEMTTEEIKNLVDIEENA